ncbi:MAG: DUF4058 family protein [Armatimonadota bacterium]|nr:DUF4058 family protein [Armatimonadota bacterium]
MTSPFPGMDPFIEGDSWQDFHGRLIGVIAEFLTPNIRPRYVVRTQERVYLEHSPGDGLSRSLGPDVSVVIRRDREYSLHAGGVVVAEAPTIVSLPMPVREREHYLTILWRETMEVVTVLEVLSPSNKRRGNDGRVEYLGKRDTVLLSRSHLVELDLLRGGERLPTLQPLPAGDYYSLVSRVERRPRAEAYAWRLFHQMPAIPIPLRAGDGDVALDLQAAFNTVYDRSDYDYSLDYSRSLEPPLNSAGAEQVEETLRMRG